MPGRVLIAYYSRTGHTRVAAEMLAAAFGGAPAVTVREITEAGSRLGFWGYCRCLLQASMGLDADIDPDDVDLRGFDLLLIGTPIWGWHLSSPVRAFARRHGSRVSACGFFCTMGGSGAESVFAELERIVGRRPRQTLALTEAELRDDRAAPRIESFAHALAQQIWPGRAGMPPVPAADATTTAARPAGQPASLDLPSVADTQKRKAA